MRDATKKPLYRKVNTRARGVHHDFGGEYRHGRSTPGARDAHMVKGVRRGLDYTPLFRFLLSSAGRPWEDVRREAESRLDRPGPMYWVVASSFAEADEVVRTGESSFFSGMYVDGDGILQITAPHIGLDDLEPSCACCTHTLNGIRFTGQFSGV